MSDKVNGDESQDNGVTQIVPIEENSSPIKKKRDPVNAAIIKVLAVCIAIFLLTILSDRYIPYTSSARVQGFVIPLTTLVGGELTQVNVAVNQLVHKGDVLARIDDEDYRIAVEKAQANLDQIMQTVGGDTELINAMEAKVASAAAQLSNYQIQAKRVFELEKQGFLAPAEGDMARAELKKAKAALEDAKANLRGKLAQLGKGDKDNPRIRSALSSLRDARLDLDRTGIVAPSDGAITDLQVREGNTVKAGQPIMTFISASDAWIEAAMRENSIGNITPGDRVDIALDIAPGRIFPGKVVSIGYGVSTGQETAPGTLPILEPKSGWIREPQHFPVIVAFADESARGLKRVGGQADLVVYAGGNPLFNILGWLWIRLVSVLSYVR